ncbi:UNKNOWN [Stylonychia lemnae]|uniref:Uncharacterized protein n=1 Tax=Stylonychia lemnae TaxID=5949 RepID=A0A078B7P2_STYLE|nr:UNKNOWN [Stylonychia lemnae]|eukprot:CDW90394.1 UNKNOWN [Stylonychia lemnae]
MLQNIERQLKNEIDSVHQDKNKNILFQSGKILNSLQINNSELWPIIISQSENQYIMIFLSPIEDDVFKINIDESQEFDKQTASLLFEEKGLLQIKVLEFIEKLHAIIRDNKANIQNMQSRFWEWFQLLIDMMLPFGDLKSYDFQLSYEMMKSMLSSNMLANESKLLKRQVPQQSTTILNKSQQLEWNPDFLYTQQNHNNQQNLETQKEQLYIHIIEEMSMINDSSSLKIDEQPLCKVNGQIQSFAKLHQSCEMTITFSGRNILKQVSIDRGATLKKLNDQQSIDQQKLNQLTYFATNNHETNILSYNIDINQRDGYLPFICKFQFKRVSQYEFQIWIRLEIHSMTKSNLLRVLVPLFEIRKISSIKINSQTIGELSQFAHPDEKFQCLIVQFLQIKLKMLNKSLLIIMILNMKTSYQDRIKSFGSKVSWSLILNPKRTSNIQIKRHHLLRRDIRIQKEE